METHKKEDKPSVVAMAPPRLSMFPIRSGMRMSRSALDTHTLVLMSAFMAGSSKSVAASDDNPSVVAMASPRLSMYPITSRMSKRKRDQYEANVEDLVTPDARFQRLLKELEYNAYFNDKSAGTYNYNQVELRNQAYHCTDSLLDYGMRRRRVQGNLLKLFSPVINDKSPSFCTILDYLQESDLGGTSTINACTHAV
jgi:hypothetical protein